MIISECIPENSSTMIIKTKIRGRDFEGLLDTGADLNYICQDLAQKLNYVPVETKPKNIVFGGGSKERVSKKMTIELEINKQKYLAEFYILKNLPVELILGTEFLSGNSCKIDYSARIITINKNNLVPMLNNKKTMEEIIVERLSEKLSLIMSEDKQPLANIKTLKYYINLNNHFSYIKNKPYITLRVDKNIPVIHKNGYSIPIKYVERGKAEIQRLLDEDIIEYSNSLYSSPAFFIKKKNNDLRLVINYQEINKYIQDDP